MAASSEDMGIAGIEVGVVAVLGAWTAGDRRIAVVGSKGS